MGLINDYSDDVSTEERRESVVLTVEDDCIEFHYRYLADVINALTEASEGERVKSWAAGESRSRR